VVAELTARVDAAVAAGVDPRRLVLDPGLGFAKNASHNWALLARLDELLAVGLPLLVGASRKSFLGRLLAGPDGTPRAAGEREEATVATTVLAALAGVWGVRVHDVARNVDAVRVAAAYTAAVRAAAAARGPATGPDTSASRPDRITLTGLRLGGRHGVFEYEREQGQEFVVDATLELDTAPAAGTDDLRRTVDYGGLAADLAAVVTGEPVNLLETLAGRLAAVCLRDPRVLAAEVTVHKPEAPIPLAFSDVSVTIRRTR
jgi:dihydropteroate synthase